MTWKRALLIYPYSPEKKSEQLYGGLAVINPIGLEIVATALKPAVEDLMLVDMRRETEPLDDLLARFRADLVGVSLNWGRDDYADALVRSLPPETTLVVGGLYATRHADEMFADFPGVDIVSVGYGEETLRELVQRGTPEGVAGLWYRRRPTAWPPETRQTVSRSSTTPSPLTGEGRGEGGKDLGHRIGPPHPSPLPPGERVLKQPEAEIVRNPRRPRVSVDHFHIDRSVRRYGYPWLTLKGDNVITSLGCPMVCAFCKWRENIFGEVQPWLGRDPEDVVDELAETDAAIVHIVDANFSADLARVEQICDLLVERDVRHLYACEIRINALARSADLVRKMERAGFLMFMIGIETYHSHLLKAMRKGYTVRMCRRAFRHLADTNIITLGNFLIGNPGETEAEMLGIADYAAELGCDFISPNKLYAYADSDFERWVLDQPGMRVVGRRRYVESDAYSVEDLRRTQAKIMLRFLRRHPPWIAYRKVLAHPMVEKLGRERIRRAILRSLWNHVSDPMWRGRALRRLLKRFRRPRIPQAAGIAVEARSGGR